jgi:hypothetical protein
MFHRRAIHYYCTTNATTNAMFHRISHTCSVTVPHPTVPYQAIPTLAYGGALEWEFYTGSLDYESLSHFALEHISKPICTGRVPENCSGDDLVLIQSLLTKSEDQLLAMLEIADQKLHEAHEAFQTKEAMLMQQQKVLVNEMADLMDKAAGKYSFPFVIGILDKKRKESKARLEALK